MISKLFEWLVSSSLSKIYQIINSDGTIHQHQMSHSSHLDSGQGASASSSLANFTASLAGLDVPASGSSSTGGAGCTEAQSMLDTFWPRVIEDIKNLTNNDFKNQELPLARIKKIMKLDDDVKVMVGI